MKIRSRFVWCATRRHGMRAFLSVAVLAMLSVAGDLPPMPGGHVAEAGQPATPSSEQPDPLRLTGRWVRPDGGYILELRDVTIGGGLKAAYYNPQPINVSRAELRYQDGKMIVFVELRDVNYPGSTYTLQYDPVSDRLKGTYFQAVAKQTYKIEFERGR
jgi:hypothetical protein